MSSYVCLRYHLIWSTKHRRSMIDESFRSRLFEYIGGIFREHGGKLLAGGGMPDHIHLLADVSKRQAIADAVRVVKSATSGWIHSEFPEQRTLAWQTGYAAFTVSNSNTDAVKEYLANQQEHHRRRSFSEELLELLKRQNVVFDPKYIAD